MNGVSHCSYHRVLHRYIDTTLHSFFISITLVITYIILISCKVVVVFLAFANVIIAVSGMVPPSAAMGRGYPGYGAMAPGYPGANPVVGAAYGYGNWPCCFTVYSTMMTCVLTLCFIDRDGRPGSYRLWSWSVINVWCSTWLSSCWRYINICLFLKQMLTKGCLSTVSDTVSWHLCFLTHPLSWGSVDKYMYYCLVLPITSFAVRLLSFNQALTSSKGSKC